MTRLWERSENFDLYEDVIPVLARLRGADAVIAHGDATLINPHAMRGPELPAGWLR